MVEVNPAVRKASPRGFGGFLILAEIPGPGVLLPEDVVKYVLLMRAVLDWNELAASGPDSARQFKTHRVGCDGLALPRDPPDLLFVARQLN